MPWNYGDILDTIVTILPPERPALVHASRTISWGDLNRRSNNLARVLLARGAETGDKVAFYMRNRVEYMETLAACFRARLTHVNVNYRYKPDEVFYIFDNSDATVVVYGSEFRDIIEEIRGRLTKVKLFIEVNEAGDAPSFAENYETLATTGNGENLGIARSGDDMFFLYTGGTTGMPKGVMWTHDAHRNAALDAARRLGPVPETMEALLEAIKVGPASVVLPACPLMHGTGLFTAIAAMASGGAIVTLDNASLDANELWAAVARNHATSISIVGDAFAKPMLKALDDAPGKYDTSSLATIVSSGVMWSVEVKRGLLGHIPQVALVDSFGASEAINFGSSIMTADGEIKTAKFQIGAQCKVFDEQDQPVEPGSGKSGIIAMGGYLPAGYYKDEAKTAKTFRTIAGHRYSIPGDWCIVEADGTLTLLGRGSACINTAGEKVYPEEVEEVLKQHPSVEDALVIGVPDDKWGQAVTGVVKVAPGIHFNEDELRAYVRQHLAGYKTPKRILISILPFRAPNGKADYKTITDFARRELNVA